MLVKRDFEKKGKEYNNSDEYLRCVFEIESVYEDEFINHGIERLVIDKK